MYSNSSAFLGGNSQRPGGPQYGGGPPLNNAMAGGQQQQQQPPPFTSQPTGFGQPSLQQQYTGYPMQSQPTGMPQPPFQQQQYTGHPGHTQPQPSFQNPMPSIPPQFQQHLHQQQHQQQQQQQQLQLQLQQPSVPQPNTFSSGPQHSSAPPPPPMKPQPTGFTEMAASFQTGTAARAPDRPAEAKITNKIPNIRLSFITAQDQAKFETLFKSAVGDNSNTMSEDKARDLLLRSRLDGDSLSHIW